jgi:DNA-binding NtrC family response regulator
MPELVFYRHGEEVLRVALEHRRLVLGRGEHCDVVIPDPQVSRQHVALHFDGKRCLFEDLSGHGTRVLGEPMQKGELPDGAYVELGPWRATFRLQGGRPYDGPTYNRSLTELKARQAQGEPLPPFQVRVRQGPNEYLHEFEADRFTVGSHPTNTVCIKDRLISALHLRVSRRESGFHVRDVGSTNGTYLNGVQVYELELPLNTALRLGDAELYFEPVSQPGQLPAHGLIGKEPAMRRAVELLEHLAPSHAPVMILGESGTGKELVAEALHKSSPRASERFLAVNCAALSPALIESELFGHEKGAFTGADTQRQGAFEAANGGTIFLDEVGELPLELQAKLLRVLENGEVKRVGSTRPFRVDVRVVAATNRNLLAESLQGRFRKDLYYRLSVLPMTLPPLRERRGDIGLLAEHFVRLFEPQGAEVRFTPAALKKLRKHSWPGNVRELRNVVQRALLVRKGPQLDTDVLTFEEVPELAPESPARAPHRLPEGMTLQQWLEQRERECIEDVLRSCEFHRGNAARRLGLSRTSLFERMKAWGHGHQGQEAR